MVSKRLVDLHRCNRLLQALLVVFSVVCTAVAYGGSWPTYRHDNQRTGITQEQLTLPIRLAWTFVPRFGPQPAWGDPKPEPVEGYLELRRMHFDDVFHPVVADGRVFFGSSADQHVYCLSAETGRLLWKFMTDGPVRLAPCFDKGQLFFASDDGYIYCLDATNGRLIWKRNLAPSKRRVLGSGKMISLWPSRTGVVVEGDVVYVGVGIFPAEGLFLYALRRDTGETIWCNDTCGENPQSRISFQGYMLLSPTTLYVPMARVSPAAFDRNTGRLKYLTYFGKSVGGAFALIAGEDIFTGTEQFVGYKGETRDRFAIFDGRQLVVTDDTAYVADGSLLRALDRKRFPAALQKLQSLRTRRAELAGRVGAQPSAAQKAQLEELDRQISQAEQEFRQAIRWSVRCDCEDGLILAGNHLIVGGNGKVLLIDANTGSQLWQHAVEGRAKGLAVADGRLFVSTDKGPIYCFASKQNLLAEANVVLQQAATTGPSSTEEQKLVEAARVVLNAAGVQEGYCLVAGLESGWLAITLARESNMLVYAVDSDPARVARVRQLADMSGLLGAKVCVEQHPLDDLPYSNYFANVVTSETALVHKRWPVQPDKLWRMVKPCGGVIIGPGLAGAEEIGPGIYKRVRGRLPSSDNWTHQYGNPGNTAATNDRIIRCPLRVLWFGRPGPGKMVNRHQRAAAPLFYEGQLFIQGENVVMAYDGYNGVKLWEREIPGARRVDVSRQGGNMAVGERGLFVAVADRCLLLDRSTGKTLRTYVLPEREEKARWGVVFLSGDKLFGSRTVDGNSSDQVFAIDINSGRPLWIYRSQSIPNSSISIDQNKLFLVEPLGDEKLPKDTLTESGQYLDRLPSGEREQAVQELKKAHVRYVVALNCNTGQPMWRQAADLTHCGATGGYHNTIATMAHNGVLTVFGIYLDGHYWRQFFAGEFGSRRVMAFDADNGQLLWTRAIGYRVRPLIIGNVFHAEPWAFDLRTGEYIKRINPITGREEPWQFARPGHHCGAPAGAPAGLFFRSLTFGYYDLLGDYGTSHFGAQRPGCWLNFLPAGGLLLMPESSTGCMCAFPNMCTVVFEPADRHSEIQYGYFSLSGSTIPVRRLGLNLGAAGDYRDSNDQLWLAFPRPGGSLVLQLPVEVKFLNGGRFVQRSSKFTPIAGTDDDWLFASCAHAVQSISVRLLSGTQGTAEFRVRLGLCHMEPLQPGQCVFDVKLQDQVARKDVDLATLTGGPARATWLDLGTATVSEKLAIELVPKSNGPDAVLPGVSAVEIVREKVLTAGCALPAVTLSALEPQTTAVVQLCNLKAEPFHGKLTLVAPPGFVVEPSQCDVNLQPDGVKTINIGVRLAADARPGKFTAIAKLEDQQGRLETEVKAQWENLGRRKRVVLHPVADTYVSAQYPTQNKGTATVLLVDGGDRRMGDQHHALAYLRFKLDLPGRPVKAVFRIKNAGNPSGDAGRICLVEGPWSEQRLNYASRPKLGRELARLGRSNSNQWHELLLSIELEPNCILDLAIDPTSCDGVDFASRESATPPELVVEYQLP